VHADDGFALCHAKQFKRHHRQLRLLPSRLGRIISKRSPGKRSDTRELVRSPPASRFTHVSYSLQPGYVHVISSRGAGCALNFGRSSHERQRYARSSKFGGKTRVSRCSPGLRLLRRQYFRLLWIFFAYFIGGGLLIEFVKSVAQ